MEKKDGKNKFAFFFFRKVFTLFFFFPHQKFCWLAAPNVSEKFARPAFQLYLGEARNLSPHRRPDENGILRKGENIHLVCQGETE